jgi:hypothetical protein
MSSDAGSDRLLSVSGFQHLLSKARINPKDLTVVGHREVKVQHEDYGFDALPAARVPFDNSILSLNYRGDKRSLRISGLCDNWKCRLEAKADGPGEAQAREREQIV